MIPSLEMPPQTVTPGILFCFSMTLWGIFISPVHTIVSIYMSIQFERRLVSPYNFVDDIRVVIINQITQSLAELHSAIRIVFKEPMK